MTEEAVDVWFAQARVLDVVHGGTAAPRSVEVVGARIARITRAAPPAGAEVVDLGGAVLAPGLVTVHTHLSIVHPLAANDENEDRALTAFRAAERARAALDAGATTIRCIHEQHQVDLLLRRSVAAGASRAPRVLAGGRALSHRGGHGKGQGCAYAEDAAGFARVARAELDAGADHLKIFITGGIARAEEIPAEPEMSAEEVSAVVAEAHARGAYVVAHAGGSAAISQAVDLGVRSFEHGYEMDEATVELMARSGVFLSPTLGVTHNPGYKRSRGFGEASVSKSAAMAPAHLASIRRAVEAGVTITNGTDFPPGDLHEGRSQVVNEMNLLQLAGLSPLECIRASTVNGARLCRVDEIGTVAEGMAADLLVLRDDPTENLSPFDDIRLVMAGGRTVRSAL